MQKSAKEKLLMEIGMIEEAEKELLQTRRNKRWYIFLLFILNLNYDLISYINNIKWQVNTLIGLISSTKFLHSHGLMLALELLLELPLSVLHGTFFLFM